MRYDVIIAGAGPNGLAAALALNPLRVAIIEARDPHAFAANGDDTRGTALTRATQAMLQALGIWPALQQHSQDIRDIIVTDDTGNLSDRRAILSFAGSPESRASAAMTENRKLASALLDAVDQASNVTLYSSRQIIGMGMTSGKAAVTTIDGTFTAPLVVAADGRNSFVRQQSEISVSQRALGQTALAFTISHEHAHQGLAQEHFLRGGGVFAVLPLPENRSSIVWAMSEAHTPRLMALDEHAFETELQNVMGNRLGRVALVGKRTSYPLQVHQAEQLYGARVALIGDAAHAIHPLAGLGLNLGFKDAAFLAETLLSAFQCGEDIGCATVLERYAQTRRFDVMSVALAVDGMNSLFASTNPVLGMIRRAGLRAVDRMPSMKSFFTAQAAGQFGNLPKLMLGLPAN